MTDKDTAGTIYIENQRKVHCGWIFDITQIWAKVPSKQLSDALVDAFKDKLKD